MNLRDVCAKYLEVNPQFAKQTKQKMGYSINRWERFVGKVGLDVTEEDFINFRAKAINARLSPHSIEQTTYDIKVLVESTGVKVNPGRMLKCPPPDPRVPELSHIGRAFDFAHVAEWPFVSYRHDWWRGFFAIGLWTAFRLGDLFAVTWDDISTGWVKMTPEKTKSYGIHQNIPIIPAIQAIIDRVPRRERQILHCPKGRKQFRRQLAEICQAADVPYFTPHGIRRAGITMWSTAHPEAGRIIHGCGRRSVMDHYLSPKQVLLLASKRVKLPEQMLPKVELDAAKEREAFVTEFLKNAPQEKIDVLMQLIRQLDSQN